jgi:hypothetical protein
METVLLIIEMACRTVLASNGTWLNLYYIEKFDFLFNFLWFPTRNPARSVPRRELAQPRVDAACACQQTVSRICEATEARREQVFWMGP